MNDPARLTVSAKSDREIVMTRAFDAPRELVFEAWTKPELLQRWLLGPPGWTMPVCDVDLRVGGTYRYVWRNRAGIEMGMGGVFREIVRLERIVSTEKFDEAWYPGEAVGTVVFTEKDGRTTVTQTMLYESREARDSVLKSPMEEGVGVSYDRLAEILASGGKESPACDGFATAVTATLSVKHWARAFDFYKTAFGAREAYRVPGGGVGRLSVAGAEFWVAEESPEHLNFSPESLGGCSVRMLLIVKDPAAVCRQAVAAGAKQVVPVGDAHGWRIGRIVDPFGHHWEIARPLE